MEPLARCGGCHRPATDGPLRRGRCARCYDAWVKARPVGLGANCAACDDRRKIHLRHWELPLRGNAPGGRWLVLCHNCAAAADKMEPPPRSTEGLKMRLSRERRWGDRRLESVGRSRPRDSAYERRAGDRRAAPRDLPYLDEVVLEMEAEFEEVTEEALDGDDITAIHLKFEKIELPES